MDDGTAKFRKPLPEPAMIEHGVYLECADRLAAYARRARTRMGEARYRELSEEWA